MNLSRPQGGWRVLCRDHECRHGTDLFASELAALEWADWGHACLSGHRLTWVGPK